MGHGSTTQSGLARRATQTRLGPQRTGLVTKRRRGGLGRERGGRQSMATAFAATSGRRAALPRSSGRPLGCAIRAIMSAPCCGTWAGVGNSPSPAQPSATTPRCDSGARSADPPSKRGRRKAVHHRLGRRVGVLSAAAGGPHLGAGRPDPRCCASRSRGTISRSSVASRSLATSTSTSKSRHTTLRG